LKRLLTQTKDKLRRYLFIILLLFPLVNFAATNTIGPIKANPDFAFYWLNRPATCGASLILSLINSTNPETALIRVYDRDLNSKEYLSFEKTITMTAGSQQITVPLTFASLILPITEIRVSVGSNNIAATISPGCAVPDYGISFQNGVFSSWTGMPTSLYAYIPWGSEPLTLDNMSSSTMTIMGVNASGAENDAVGPVGGPVTIAGSKTVTVTPGNVSWLGTGPNPVIWKFNFSESSLSFMATGFPLILASDQSAATALQAGMIYDGSHNFAHPTQNVIINTYLPQLAKFAGNPASEASLLATITKQQQMLNFPNSYLLSIWGPIYDLSYSLANQNLLSGSDWYGSSAGWQHRDPFSGNTTAPILQPTGSETWIDDGTTVTGPLVNPQRWFRQAAALVSGVAPEMQLVASTDDGTATSGFAYLTTLNGAESTVPWTNPFLWNKALIYQAALAALRDLAVLPSDEVWNNSSTMLSTYPGGEIAFLSARKIFLNYGKTGFLLRRLFCASSPTTNEQVLYNCTQINKIAPMKSTELTAWNFSHAEITLWKNVYAAWTFTVERFAYRMWPNNLVSYRNQSSHMLYSFQLLADGSGSTFDQGLATSYASRWIAGQDPAGWFMESEGPDGSYNGMSDYHVGSYYLDTCIMGACNENMATSLAKAYTFFSYTVAPEPGTVTPAVMMGGFPFNHRVGQGFDMEFWGGARGIANTIPQVSAWNPIYNSPPNSVPTFPASGGQNGDFNANRYIGILAYPPVTGAAWPAESATDFTTDVNDAGELIAAKRAGYYTAIYLAHPASNQVYIVGINTPNERLAWPGGAESNGCQIGDPDGAWSTPFVGGGVTLFWTPDLGSAILAGNWTPLAHHGLVVTDGQTGVRTWEDYFSVSHSLSDTNVLTVTGNLESSAPTSTLHLQPIVNETYSTRSACGYPAPSGTAPKSNVDGLSYSRAYTFGEYAMMINLNVSAGTGAVIPAGTTMIENIPVPGGSSKTGGSGQPVFYLPGTPASPIENNTTVNTNEIDIKGSTTTAGIRIVFANNQNIIVVTNGPISEYKNYQINRLQIAMAVPAPGKTTQLKYCVESLTQSISDCVF
jgi:hypothetical protein